MAKTDSTCDGCGGHRLIVGHLLAHWGHHAMPNGFAPEDGGDLERYPMRAYVCRDCGFVGQYLDEPTLRELEQADRKRRLGM